MSIFLQEGQYSRCISNCPLRQLDCHDKLAVDLDSEKNLALNLRQDCFVVEAYPGLLNVSAPELLEYFGAKMRCERVQRDEQMRIKNNNCVRLRRMF